MGRNFCEEWDTPILGTTGIPLLTKTSSILPDMARLEPYISAVVRGRLRSLSCLAIGEGILWVGPDNLLTFCTVCVPCTISRPYATDESRSTKEGKRVGKIITYYEVYVVGPLPVQEIEGIIRQRKRSVAIAVANKHRFSSPQPNSLTCLYERP